MHRNIDFIGSHVLDMTMSLYLFLDMYLHSGEYHVGTVGIDIRNYWYKVILEIPTLTACNPMYSSHPSIYFMISELTKVEVKNVTVRGKGKDYLRDSSCSTG